MKKDIHHNFSTIFKKFYFPTIKTVITRIMYSFIKKVTYLLMIKLLWDKNVYTICMQKIRNYTQLINWHKENCEYYTTQMNFFLSSF